ncbi:MAG: cation transporter [Betaproteobacteria bacterium]|nr:cation transporter [Betaproteobacteria bacterium]
MASALALAGTAIAGEPARVKLDVPSMNCSLCPIAVSGVLRKQSGVHEAKADLASKTAQVVFDPDKTSPARLAQAVSDSGYPATARAP